MTSTSFGDHSPSATEVPHPARYVPWEQMEGRFVDRAAAGRVTSVLRGDGHDWAIDREFADRALQILPDLGRITRANRAFVARALRHCAGRGVRQVVDLGCGYPTDPPLHTLAEDLAPGIRCVYVDVDAVAVAHTCVLLREEGDPARQAVLQHDLRAIGTPNDPLCGVDDVWSAVRATGLITEAEPVALVLSAVLQHIAPGDGAEAAVAELLRRLPPGSYVILSHATTDGASGEQAGQLAALQSLHAREAAHPVHYRSRDQLAALVRGCELIEPGIVVLPHWRPTSTTGAVDPAPPAMASADEDPPWWLAAVVRTPDCGAHRDEAPR